MRKWLCMEISEHPFALSRSPLPSPPWPRCAPFFFSIHFQNDIFIMLCEWVLLVELLSLWCNGKTKGGVVCARLIGLLCNAMWDATPQKQQLTRRRRRKNCNKNAIYFIFFSFAFSFFQFQFGNKSTPFFFCQQKISELNGLILYFHLWFLFTANSMGRACVRMPCCHVSLALSICSMFAFA